MKLYGSYTSPFVRHCRVALMEGEHEFEFIEADYAMSAERSPTAKVPYFADGDRLLTDSSSILKYVREKSGQAFLADLDDCENFALANTTLDSAINLFLLENEGFGPEQIKYLGRQKTRVENGLKQLDERLNLSEITPSGIRDGALRCACCVDWGLFRKRINIDAHSNLQALLAAANQTAVFANTAPPR